MSSGHAARSWRIERCLGAKDKRVKAIVKQSSGKGHVELVEWPEPSPAPDEVKLKIVAAGICGTDIHIIEGTWQCRPPVVLGHEFCGIVVESGALVKDFRAGERVVASN